MTGKTHQTDILSHPYAGRWIARIGNQILTHGYDPAQVRAAARQLRHKEIPLISYIPQAQVMVFPESFYQLQTLFQHRQDIYLVGGAVRDALLNLPLRDLDFVCMKDTRQIAKQAADHFKAAFYCMDEARETYRVILPENQRSLVMDFMGARAKSLEEDLYERDFTINAMAIDLQDPQKLIDPMHGAQALHEKMLIACNPQSFEVDPVRILRGVRLAAEGQYHIEKLTRDRMKSAIPGLADTSIERRREELFRMMSHPKAATSLRALDWLGSLPYLISEISIACEEVGKEWWNNLLVQIDHWYELLEYIVGEYPEAGAKNIQVGLAVLKVGIFRTQLQNHFLKNVDSSRSRYGISIFALLSETTATILGDNVLPETLARRYHLSRVEINWVREYAIAYRKVDALIEQQNLPSAVEIYKFFRDAHQAGIDAIFGFLAQEMISDRSKASVHNWEQSLEICRIIFDTYWNHPEIIDPPVLLTGDHLVQQYHLSPGPEVGEILELMREEQASGRINNLTDADIWLQEKL